MDANLTIFIIQTKKKEVWFRSEIFWMEINKKGFVERWQGVIFLIFLHLLYFHFV